MRLVNQFIRYDHRGKPVSLSRGFTVIFNLFSKIARLERICGFIRQEIEPIYGPN